ncbi:MAG: sulfotransferase family 2 domain-containing protein [Pseudomonadota bacterium]|nr:sulfotransferase family 2 domain-containing protein [Pseudomonadota bacterium]
MRELAHLAGFGHTYFISYWTKANSPVAEYKGLQDETQSIFIHIPKAAGMSIHHVLFDSEELHGHAPAIAYYSRDPERFQRYFTFTLMREPTNRFVSAFFYLKTAALTDRDGEWGKRYLSAFDTPDALLTAMARNPFLRARIMSWVHFTPQAWYLTDRQSKVIVDYIGRVETFDESMSEIAARLGKTYAPTHSNKSKRPRDLALGPQAKTLLENLYADDFLIYHDRFGNT